MTKKQKIISGQHTHTSLVEDVTDYEQVAQAIDNLAYKGLKKENMHYVFASHDPTMRALAAKVRKKYAVKHGLYPEQLASFAMKYDELVKKEEDVPKLNYQQGDCYQLDAVIQGNNIVRYSVQRIEEKFLQEESKKIAYRSTIDVKDQALTGYLKKQTEAYIKAWHYDEGGLLLVFTFTKTGLFLSKKEPCSSRFARMHHRLSLKFPLPKQDNNIRGSIIFTTPETAIQDEQGNVGYETGSNLAMKKKWKTFNYLGKIQHGYEEPKARAKGSLKLKEHVVYNFSSKNKDAVIKDMQNINLADYPFKHDGEVAQSYRPLIEKCLIIVAFYSIARILLWLREKPSKDA